MTARVQSYLFHCSLFGVVLALELGTAAVVIAAGNRGAADPPPKMILKDGRLTVEIVGRPLRQVMEEIGRLSGTEVRGLGAAEDERVSVRFADLPLPDAIGRVLRTRSFLLVTSAAGGSSRLAQIVILESGRRLDVETSDAADRLSPPAEIAAGLAGRRDEVPSGDPLDALITAALDRQDPLARRRAMDELGVLAESDPRARIAQTELSETAVTTDGAGMRGRLPTADDLPGTMARRRRHGRQPAPRGSVSEDTRIAPMGRQPD